MLSVSVHDENEQRVTTTKSMDRISSRIVDHVTVSP